MDSDYYDLRGQIVSKERRISALNERLEMWAQYQKYKPVRQKLDKVAPGKREQFEQRHSADLALFDAAVRYLDMLKTSGESITPKAWRTEAQRLTAEKGADYLKMGETDHKTLFVDGTKLESRAGRYTFIWRKSVGK